MEKSTTVIDASLSRQRVFYNIQMFIKLVIKDVINHKLLTKFLQIFFALGCNIMSYLSLSLI